MVLKTFGWSFAITAIALVGSFVLGGAETLALVAILIVLEISLSFDNSVVNATILKRMNLFWQKLFLTVGILIAVFGMRLIFPLLLVGVTASLGPIEAVRLALEGGSAEEPGTYANLLEAAHPAIAAFGGMFLLMLFLDFIFDDEREVLWLTPLERPLQKMGRLDLLPIVVALVLLSVTAGLLDEESATVLSAGVLGVITYALVNGLSDLLDVDPEEADDVAPITRALGEDDHADERAVGADQVADKLVGERASGPSVVGVGGRAAFLLFMSLEVIDASFSFDGVIGAFAITQNIFIIAVGLGVGALYIRSITIYLVRQGTLEAYRYLEHGAFWAIGALAGILLVSISTEVPELITGLVGVSFIAAASVSSVLANRRDAGAGEKVSA